MRRKEYLSKTLDMQTGSGALTKTAFLPLLLACHLKTFVGRGELWGKWELLLLEQNYPLNRQGIQQNMLRHPMLSKCQKQYLEKSPFTEWSGRHTTGNGQSKGLGNDNGGSWNSTAIAASVNKNRRVFGADSARFLTTKRAVWGGFGTWTMNPYQNRIRF